MFQFFLREIYFSILGAYGMKLRRRMAISERVAMSPTHLRAKCNASFVFSPCKLVSVAAFNSGKQFGASLALDQFSVRGMAFTCMITWNLFQRYLPSRHPVLTFYWLLLTIFHLLCQLNIEDDFEVFYLIFELLACNIKVPADQFMS